MSDATTKTLTTADKLLASIRRGAEVTPDALRRLGVEPKEAAAEPARPEATEAETPVHRKSGGASKPAKAAAKPARRDDSRGAGVQRNVDFDVSTGRGIKHLTIRVPKEMAADLALMAMRNKLSENGEPTTINELGIQALQGLLDAAA